MSAFRFAPTDAVRGSSAFRSAIAVVFDRDRVVSEGWRSGWQDRTLLSLQWYMIALQYILVGAIFYYAFISRLGVHRSWKICFEDPTGCRDELTKLDRKVSKGHWYVALIYAVHAIGVGLVDMFVRFNAPHSDDSSGQQAWTSDVFVAIGLYCAHLVAVSAVVNIVFPSMQMAVAIQYSLCSCEGAYGLWSQEFSTRAVRRYNDRACLGIRRLHIDNVSCLLLAFGMMHTC